MNYKSTETIEKQIKQAVSFLKQGKLVIIPTETVYGLGADASNPNALKKIFKAKGRPQSHPLIVHIADSSYLSEWAVDIPETAYKLAKTFWPGPLTLVLKRAPHVSTVITGGQDTIALRVPAHPIAQQILSMFKGGIAAPSANSFGYISPTTIEHVNKEMGNKVSLIIDGGPCQIGIESTIIDLSHDEPTLLRPGMISHVMIEQALGRPVDLHPQSAPRISGSLPSHYAPITPTILVESSELQSFVESKIKISSLAVLARQACPYNKQISDYWLNWIALPNKPKAYANKLYKEMRQLDLLDFDSIIIEDVPDDTEWLAIRDRIKRASAS